MFVQFSDVCYTVINVDDISGCRLSDCREATYPYQILLYLNQDYENPMVLEYDFGNDNQRREDYTWLSNHLVNNNLEV